MGWLVPGGAFPAVWQRGVCWQPAVVMAWGLLVCGGMFYIVLDLLIQGYVQLARLLLRCAQLIISACCFAAQRMMLLQVGMRTLSERVSGCIVVGLGF
jgi:hypothetical protein